MYDKLLKARQSFRITLYTVAMPKDSVPVTSKPAIRAQTLHFLTTCFVNTVRPCIIHTCNFGLSNMFTAVVCLPTLPVSHHEYPYAKALVTDPAHMKELRVRIPPRTWMSVSCEYCVLSGRGLCDWPIPRSEESCNACVCVCESVI